MDTFVPLTALLCFVPLVVLVAFGAARLFGFDPSERFTFQLVVRSLDATLLSFVALAVGLFVHHGDHVVVSFGSWFSLARYEFPLEFLVDDLSLTFLGLSLVLTSLVARFSGRYLHRDPGYHRFFLLLLAFVVGMNFLALAGTIDLLFLGWELVGLSSALLVAFFQTRRDPLENGLHVFSIYRFTDVGLLAGAVLLHHYAHSAAFDVAFGQAHWPSGLPRVQGSAVHVITFLFLVAALGKSAQVPFGGWLPRAMEGPTPSSAIFYGGISIHAGAFLLLRAAPLLDRSPPARVAIFALGALTALFGTVVGRVQADAKNQLAYASMSQVGLIFVEIALGLRFLALLHVAGHASVRTLQFLRAPSVLAEFHRIQAGRDGVLARTGLHYEMLLPERLRRRLYALALDGAGFEGAFRRFVKAPLGRFLETLERGERSLGRPPDAPDSARARVTSSEEVHP